MTLLGNNFLDSYKIKRLKVGSVIYIHCHFTIPAKNKYHLVCCCDPLLVLLINSNIPPFIARNSVLRNCQVEMSYDDHRFLKWNSFINCIDAHSVYDISFFKKQLKSNFNNFYMGDISANCVRDIIIAINISPTMIPKHKKMITEELEALLLRCRVTQPAF